MTTDEVNTMSIYDEEDVMNVMKTLTAHAQITEDGLLKLEVPCDLSPGEVEIVLVVQPIDTKPTVDNGPPYHSLHGIWAGKLPDIDVLPFFSKVALTNC